MISLKKNEKQLAAEMMSKVSLAKDKSNLEAHVVSLSKCVVDLSKKEDVDLGVQRARVAIVLDYSGSMTSLYKNGTVQNTLTRLVPLGLQFDDNGSLDFYLFSSNYKKLPDVNVSNYDNYIGSVIRKSGMSMGGTVYAAVLSDILGIREETTRSLFKSKTVMKETGTSIIDDKGDSVFVLFITDGDNSDKAATDKIIRESAKHNIFIQFVGVGSATFEYLEKLDNLSDRVCDNTGFVKMRDLEKVSDIQLYTLVLNQFVQWLKLKNK